MDKFPHGAEGWSDARGQNLVGNGLVAQDHFISAKERGLMGYDLVKIHKADPIATRKVSSPLASEGPVPILASAADQPSAPGNRL